MNNNKNLGELLVVDDTPANLKLLMDILRTRGYKVRPATDGNQALAAVAAQKPELILLDIKMPDIDGYEVCRRLKADENTRDIPIIFISAHDTMDDRVKGFDLGGVDYIIKPFQEKDILVRVHNHLKLYRMQINLEAIIQERTMELRAEIAERKRSEEALAKAQIYISNIINSMPSILIGVDKSGLVTQWNIEAQRITGLLPEQALGRYLYKIFPHLTTEMKQVNKAIKMREVCTDPKRAYREDGETRYEDVTVYPLIANGVDGAVIRVDDVTDKVRMEEMMIQSEKMLSVGGLAAGMAHEINNPLAGIMQTANVMNERLSNIEMEANQKAAEEIGIHMNDVKAFMEKRGILRMMATINEAGHRMADIVDNMLGFARKSDAEVSSHDLGDLLDKALKLAETDYDLKKHYDFKTIEIQKNYEPDLPMVPCEGTKIQQVLLNILGNGAQAMQEVSKKNKDHRPRFILRLSKEPRTNMLRMEIEDNGSGMDQETRKRIFEPFFTTKPVGVGTGLGLYVSYFIITKNHGGTMDVKSEPGKGTTFIIRLSFKGIKA